MKIWDNKNKQQLCVSAIYFSNNEVFKINAHKENETSLGDPFYNIEGDDLKYVAIDAEIKFNIKLIPDKKKDEVIKKIGIKIYRLRLSRQKNGKPSFQNQKKRLKI